MKSRIALSILAVFPLTATTAQTAAEDRASAKDCAVMQAVVIERGGVRTLGLAPDSFGLDCEWVKRLGSPVVPREAPGLRNTFKRPSYLPDGLQASLEYWEYYTPAHWGTDRYPYMHSFNCTLMKDRADWHLVRCRVGASAN